MNNRQFDQKLISADNPNTWTMDPVNLNEASKDELKKLPGCGKGSDTWDDKEEENLAALFDRGWYEVISKLLAAVVQWRNGYIWRSLGV